MEHPEGAVSRMRALTSRLKRPPWLQDYALLTAGGLLLAVTLNIFLAPADIAPGGVTGAAILINHFVGWPIGLIMLVLNVPLVVLGFAHLGRFRFLTRT